jgi:4-diphosphocytidyl-2-C-methyl-D-erythritol kinase
MPENEPQWTQKAYAKITLLLDVTGKRSDGYHEVSMIMQSVNLFDTVSISLRHETISLRVDRQDLPCDSSNLAFRAAELLQQECGVSKGVHIDLVKRIPLAAGLAGGSSDAAAVLRGLNQLWQLSLSAGDLEQLAARLGSDVPFCLWGGTVHATGRGEILEPLADFAGIGVVLAHPPLQVSTAWVYGNYQLGVASGCPDIALMRRAIAHNDFSVVTQNLYNALETVTVPAYPQIGEIKTALSQAGASGVLMSGSGPTVFALSPTLAEAKKLAARLSIGPEVDILIAETVAREEQMNVPTIITG